MLRSDTRRRAEGRIGIAAKCGSVILTESLADGAVDEAQWLHAAIDRLVTAGASGALFVFIHQPPDQRLADVLRTVTTARRLGPSIVASPTAIASRAAATHS